MCESQILGKKLREELTDNRDRTKLRSTFSQDEAKEHIQQADRTKPKSTFTRRSQKSINFLGI